MARPAVEQEPHQRTVVFAARGDVIVPLQGIREIVREEPHDGDNPRLRRQVSGIPAVEYLVRENGELVRQQGRQTQIFLPHVLASNGHVHEDLQALLKLVGV